MVGLGRTSPRKTRAMASKPQHKAGGSRRLLPALGFVGLLAIAAGLWQAQQLATESPQFRVAALEVRGLRLMTGEDVLQSSGVQVGDGLFDIDLDAVARRLDNLVWVRSSRIERRPPDRLVVHLEERRRVAWLSWHQRQYGIDVDGVLLPPDRLATEGIADLNLPVLRTPDLGDSLAVGLVVADSSVHRLLTWWSRAQAVAPELTHDISEFGRLDEEALVLRLVADNLEIRLPFNQVHTRLSTLREVLNRVYRECPNPVYVDLRFEGQVVIGRQPSAAVSDVVSMPRTKTTEPIDAGPPHG